MADAQDPLYFPESNPLNMQLKGLDHIIGIDVLPFFEHRERVLAGFAPESLAPFDDAAFDEFPAFAFGAAYLFHDLKLNNQLYLFSKTISN